MATIPKRVTLTNSSVDILNVIRNNSTQNYQDYIPKATKDADSIREIGAIIMDYPQLQNEFLSSLVNRIGRVIVTSKSYSNPWAMFKKGLLEFGETVEELFVNIAKPFEFDPEVAESEVFKREIPDVRSAFHIMNYQKFYKVTISNEQLRQAFLSWDGIVDLIAKITDSLYTGANYDEFLTMKYLLARHILDGKMNPKEIMGVTAENMNSIVSTIKGVSNKFEFLSGENNVAHVKTSTKKDEQYLLVNSEFDAKMDVEVLASAFNMEKAEFLGHRVLVDSFGSLDNERLAKLFEHDTTYKEVTDEEMTALNAIPCVLVDKDWFMVFDNLIDFTENYNGQGLYWNYYYHVWKTFSVSPFAQNALFLPSTPTVVSVTVSPSEVTVTAGQSAFLSAVVETTNFAPKTVNWSIELGSGSSGIYVDSSGNVTTDKDAVGSAEVKATSVFDNTVSGVATVTLE